MTCKVDMYRATFPKLFWSKNSLSGENFLTDPHTYMVPTLAVNTYTFGFVGVLLEAATHKT